MKKLAVVLLGVLALNTFSVAAAKKGSSAKGGASLEQSLNNLEAQLQKLEQLEQQKFNEQEALANAAQQRLNNYLSMQSTVDQRLADIEANAELSIFGKEFKDKAKEFRTLRAELDKEIAKEQKIIEDFELLKSLR